MTIDRIKISSDNNGNTWIGAECTPDHRESADEAFKALQQKIAEWHTYPNAINQPLVSKSAPAGEALPTIDRGRERLKDRIWDADTVEALTKLLVHIPVSDNELNEIWRAKHNQLSTAK